MCDNNEDCFSGDDEKFCEFGAHPLFPFKKEAKVQEVVLEEGALKTKSSRNARKNGGNEKTEDANETKETEKTEDTEETKETEKIEDTEETKETEKTEDTEETKETEKTEDTEETEKKREVDGGTEMMSHRPLGDSRDIVIDIGVNIYLASYKNRA